LATVACGDDDRATLGQLCNGDDGVFRALVDKLFTCNPVLVEFIFPVEPTSADVEASCEALIQPFVDDGTVRYGDSDEVRACLNAIENLDCESFDFDLVPECQDLVLGRIEEGGECEGDAQCAGDSYCDQSGSGTCGVCVARKPDGASCDEEEECVGRNCSDGECLTPGEVGADCNGNDDCLGTLVCNSVSGECQRASSWAIGDACTAMTDDCAAFETNLFCNGQTEECEEFLELGEICTGGAGLCNFAQKEFCDALGSGTCAGATTVGENQECNLFLGRVCADGLLCSGLAEGTCIEPAQEGDDCDENDDQPCLGGLFLECVSSKCQLGDFVGECPLPE
jgi:hypothetical protein